MIIRKVADMRYSLDEPDGTHIGMVVLSHVSHTAKLEAFLSGEEKLEKFLGIREEENNGKQNSPAGNPGVCIAGGLQCRTADRDI